MNFEQTGYVETIFAKSGLADYTITPSLSEDIAPLISNFPKTRYYGSKRRLLEWIYHALKDLPFNTVLDGFGGTASVSLLFKMMGKEVTFHDGLLCNTIPAYALLSNKLPFSNIKEAHSFIDEITPRRGFISKTFAGMYYTDEENRWLDGAASAIHKIEDPARRSIYLYCLFQACLKKRPFNLFHRANLSMRLNHHIYTGGVGYPSLGTFRNHVKEEGFAEYFQRVFSHRFEEALDKMGIVDTEINELLAQMEQVNLDKCNAGIPISLNVVEKLKLNGDDK